MEGESFALEMRDAMSGPARAMKDNLAALKVGMSALGTEILALQKKQIAYKEAGLDGIAKSAGFEIARQRLQMKGMADQVKQTTLAQKGFADQTKAAQETAKGESAALAELTGGLSEVLRATLAVGAGIAGLVFGGAALAIQAGTFRTHMTNVYSIFRGTATEGAKTYEMVRQMSRTLPIPQEKAFESAQELLSLGLQGTNRLHNTVQAIADMQGVMGDAAGSKLKSIIGGAQTSTMGGRFRGVFSVTPAELKEIGLSYDQLSGVIAKKLGKTNSEAKQMLMYGRIDAATGIDALNQAIAKGDIGKAAEDALLAPDVLLARFKTNVSGLFSDVDYKPFMVEVRNIVNLFDSGNSSGKNMKSTVTDVFNSLAKTGKSALIDLQIGFLTLQGYFLDAEIALLPLSDGLDDLLGDDAGLIAIESAALLAGGAIVLAAIAAVTLGAVLVAPFVLAGIAGKKAGEAIHAIGDAADGLKAHLSKDGMTDIARNVIDGLVDGLTKGSKLVSDAMGTLGGGAITSLNAALGNKSPSVKGRLAGRNLALGVKMGADAEGLDVGGGALTLRAPPPSGPSGGGKPAGNVYHVTVAPGAVVVHGGSDAGAVMALLEPAVADLFERIAEELGHGNA